MIDVPIRKGIDPIVAIEESNLAVEFCMDKITEADQGMNQARGANFRGNARTYQNQGFRRQNDRGGTEEIIEIEIMKEVGLGLEKGYIEVIS